MGDWAIVVHGTGAHHNKDYPTDADRMSQKFVDDLILAGHDVKLATFTAGGRTVLDTIDNLEARQLRDASTSDMADRIRVAAGERQGAHGKLGLNPSPRKEPLDDPNTKITN